MSICLAVYYGTHAAGIDMLLRKLTHALRRRTTLLAAAVAAGGGHTSPLYGGDDMSGKKGKPAHATAAGDGGGQATIDALVTAVENFETVADGATALITGFQARLDAAVAAATANGATAEQLAPLTQLSADVKAKADALAAAVTANAPNPVE
jgi:hypothetical protein